MASNNGKLSKMTYAANSDLVWSVTYVYDSLDRIFEVWYTDNEFDWLQYVCVLI